MALVAGEPISGHLIQCDPERLTNQARLHKLLAPLAQAVLAEDAAPRTWKRWALFRSMAEERALESYGRACGKTAELLGTIGVNPVILKGASLSFGRPRDAGDVDFLIPEESLVAAIHTLENAGYRYRGYERNRFIRRGENRNWTKLLRWSNQFEFTEPDTGALVELHTRFFEPRRVYAEDLSALHRNLGGFVDRSVKAPEFSGRFLSLEDRALLFSMHVALKRGPANRDFILRHVDDFRRICDAGPDWDLAVRRASELGIAHHLYLAATLLGRFRGAAVPERLAALAEGAVSKRAASLERLHSRCLIDVDRYDRPLILLYQWLAPLVLPSSWGTRFRSLAVFPLFLPPVRKLERIYGLRPRSAFGFALYLLEPIRLTFRLGRKLARVVSRTHRKVAV